MHYQIKTYQGVNITLNEGFELDKYLSTLLNPQIESVAIGTVSMLKRNIQRIRPVYEEGESPVGEKVLVYSPREPEPYIAHVEDYDAAQTTKQVNDRNLFIRIGDTIINRDDYSLVMQN
ncbi:hypothetical protein [Sporosarcina highlanderae]|uniref:Uncharacterized protein n=1 Tax=Sporosarcina highlanderae TaxID=3035916 RepID=A0ABT8JVA7_9BACL|nr:hypothetical protein [Sporosarcina highlanderae]MDN4609115.1 hypothetical protein [Sporosarcina highlanderae]